MNGDKIMVGSRTSIRGPVISQRPIGNVAQFAVGVGPVLTGVRDSLSTIRGLLDSTDHAVAESIQIQKMASMEHLAKGLCHDLNNGLMTIAATIYLLEKEFPQPDIQQKILAVRKVLDNMEGLVNHLQALGSDEITVELVHRDLTVEVKLVLDALKSSFTKNINLHFTPCGNPLPVLLSQGDIWRILSNLAVNAQEAMAEGGDLLVGIFKRIVDSSYCRQHGNAYPGTFAVLSVCDHGSGIPKDMLNRIFDPLFSTKEASGKSRKRGWGLAIIFALIRRRGGWIDVTSIPGKGSTFEVFLPLQVINEVKNNSSAAMQGKTSI
ncbi:MAG TPA: HAMP domain-containing histidine kinase [Deltaproteobacteria bacterium]|nr:HAMP domain-containing histidine kinase [Deltaproteobacteria bacterium]